MALISIETLRPPPPRSGFALFALGFRPFFLGAGAFAVLLMALWLAFFRGEFSPAFAPPPVQWHAHEMLFGYAGAVVAGFLLTAVRNWTGLPTPSGKPLAALFLLWLAGRLASWLPGTPPLLYALIDLALFPALLIAIARPLLRARQPQNYVFPLMLGLLALANLLMHAEWLGYAQSAVHGYTLALAMIVLMMVVMGGRVIPSFTDNKLRTQARRWQFVEWLAPGLTLAVPAAMLAAPAAPITTALALTAALVHGVRLYGWYTPRYWSVPLLWILHLGYAWIALGFLLTALATLGLASPTLALHAFTAGAIGSLTLGMMARVALGHTGRMLEPARSVGVAFALVVLAGALRVLPPLFAPATYSAAILGSGLLWIAAFALFVFNYASLLIRPRVDGKPG